MPINYALLLIEEFNKEQADKMKNSKKKAKK